MPIFCNDCGAKNIDGSTYCEECGTKLSNLQNKSFPVPIASQNSLYTCNGCGYKNAEHAIWCEDCGASLSYKNTLNKTKLKTTTIISSVAVSETAANSLNKGKAFVKERKYKEAIECFDKVLASDTKNVDAWNEKGAVLNAKENYKEALQYFDKALKINPNHVDTLNNKGEALYEQGNYKKALECFEKALKINPSHIEALKNKGTTLHIQRNYEEAFKYFKKALEVNPTSIEILRAKGSALRRQENYEEALKCYDKALEIAPEDVDTWNEKGLTLSAQGSYEESIKYYDRSLQINPGNGKSMANKGAVLFKKGEVNEALKYFDKALKIESEYVYAWNGKGIVLYTQGNYEEAIKCFDKALELNPYHVETLKNKGTVSGNRGNYEEAFKYLNKALELNPNHIETLKNKGSVLYKQENYEEAIKCFDKALKLNPDEIYLKNLKRQAFLFKEIPLIIALTTNGTYEDVLKCIDKIDKILEIYPDYQILQENSEYQTKIKELLNMVINSKLTFSNMVATNLFNQGNIEEAINLLQKALSINPNHIETLINLGTILTNEKKYEEAIPYFNKILYIEPENVNALLGKGKNLANQGKYEEAIQYIDKALHLNPDEIEIKELRREVILFRELPLITNLATNGNYEEAIKCIDKTLELYPDYRFIQENSEYQIKIKELLTMFLDLKLTFSNIVAIELKSKVIPPKIVIKSSKQPQINQITSADDWNLKGIDYITQNKFEEAIICYDKALEIDSRCYKAWNNKGLALHKQGKITEAIDCYDKALEIAPEHKDSLHNKGHALENYSVGPTIPPITKNYSTPVPDISAFERDKNILSGRYYLVQKIGKGAMGEVYKAKDLSSNQIVAIKLLYPHLQSGKCISRFKSEAEYLSTLSHPNIVKLYSFEQNEVNMFYVMEYIVGKKIRTHIKLSQTPVEDVLKCAVQICDALDYAHSMNKIHRDIKPENILIDSNLNVKILDFGISKGMPKYRTYKGYGRCSLIGTVQYEVPEHIQGEQLTSLSDLYSLGVTLYELLTQQLPFSEGRSNEVFFPQLFEKPVPPTKINKNIPKELELILLKLLEKDPGKRFQSAKEIKERLKVILIKHELDNQILPKLDD